MAGGARTSKDLKYPKRYRAGTRMEAGERSSEAQRNEQADSDSTGTVQEEEVG